MIDFKVDASRCNCCGMCVRDCPASIIEQKPKSPPFISRDKETNCLECQHCLAICPKAAISILGHDPERSLPANAKDWPRGEQMNCLIRGRRSVRAYKKENVPAEQIRSLLDMVAHAPTGVNQCELTFTVIDDKDVMQRFRDKVMTELGASHKSGKLSAGHAFLGDLSASYFADGTDTIFRGAPHALIVSAPPDAPCAREDVIIALSYFELAAQCAGLGTVWCGFVKVVLETLPHLKPMLMLPPEHAYYVMLFGKPAVHYARTTQREDAAVRQVVRL